MHVEQYLTNSNVWFEVLKHRPTYNAQQRAQTLHVPGDEVAKTVLLRADQCYVLAVLPATYQIDLMAAKKSLGCGKLELATELEFGKSFPDCEIGALPPFGSKYGMKTLVDQSLAAESEIVFEGNTHEEAIRMRYNDFRKLEHPIEAEFCRHL